VGWLDDLTESQREAVTHVAGPLLVLAGPGSGKTRVVTRRIAHLVQSGIPPGEIVAITFTNKAAGEMQARVEQLLPGAKVWVSTFHRFCVRLLRRYARLVGLAPNFTILDTADQKQLIRRAMADLDLDAVHFPPEKVLWHISNAKNDLVTPERYRERFEESIANYQQSLVAQVYPAYQRALLAANAVDFDDLLMHVAVLLDENDEVREELDDRYRYILVDEYQDTNLAQYRIAAGLSQRNRNLCVTGDPDQSIYGWRGARIENILRFERDFPGAKVVRLEENFRSRGAILRSADRLIAHNSRRKAKRLFSNLGEGTPVQLWQFPTAEHEADAIARRIRAAVARHGRHYDDFAVVYRINALSRLLEHALRRYRVPFQVAAGFEFYERAEIKDALAYLRLVHNPADRAAFVRIVNTPLRGLGKTSQDRLLRWADEQGLTCLEAAARAGEVPKLSKQARAGFRRFAEMMQEFSLADAGSVEGLLVRIIARTRLAAAWEGSPSEEDQQRLANVNELVSAARSCDRMLGSETSLEAFLEQTSLVNDTDSVDAAAGKVTLLTLHAAKGLEFPVVYIIGLEQGLLPHERAVSGDADPHELEEERRLLFVGMTRAREELHLTIAQQRSIRGQERHTIPSPFLSELEAKLGDETEWEADAAVGVVDGTDEAAGGEALFATAFQDQAGKPPREAASPSLGDLKSRLMTGADLLNGARSMVELPTGFAVGAQVRHPRYGLGTVIDVSGFGARRTVTVRFEEDDRQQSFVAGQSPLQPVGVGSC
jgi:DNA helicase-2/ATP-dependent DNA helicase PcrA